MGHTGYPVFWLIFAQSGNSAPCTRPQLAEAQIPSSASRLGCFAHWSAPEAPHSVSGPRVHLGKGPFLFLCPATTSPLHWVLRGSGGTAPRGSPQGTTAGSKDGRRCLVLGGPPLNTPGPVVRGSVILGRGQGHLLSQEPLHKLGCQGRPSAAPEARFVRPEE